MILIISIRRIIISIVIVIYILILTGCWNYREIDQLAVVAGAAIDKGENEKYSLTVEIVEISGEKGAEIKSKTLTFEGQTIFDAARNAISFVGKRLYWSHTKVVIISREIAEERIIDVLDWFNRDAETRGDIHIIVSKAGSAKEILNGKATTEDVISFEIDDMLKNQKSLSKAPQTEIWELTNNLPANGKSAIAAAIDFKKDNGEVVPHIGGTAIFKGDKLVGFLDEVETRSMLFVLNDIKGGLLVQNVKEGDNDMNISLEIFKSKTKVKPSITDGNMEIKISTELTVAIDEIEGTKNVIEEAGRKELEEIAGKSLKSQIQSAIRKVQSEYGADIFGFGAKIKQGNPKVWDTLAENWSEKFKDLKTSVEAKVHIKNSAMLAKTLEVGD